MTPQSLTPKKLSSVAPYRNMDQQQKEKSITTIETPDTQRRKDKKNEKRREKDKQTDKQKR